MMSLMSVRYSLMYIAQVFGAERFGYAGDPRTSEKTGS